MGAVESEVAENEQRLRGIEQIEDSRQEQFNKQREIWHEYDLQETPDRLRRSDAYRCLEDMLDVMERHEERVKIGEAQPLTSEDIQRIYEETKETMREQRSAGRTMLSENFNEKDVMRAAIGELGWKTVAKRYHGTNTLNEQIELTHQLIEFLRDVVAPVTEGTSVIEHILTKQITSARVPQDIQPQPR